MWLADLWLADLLMHGEWVPSIWASMSEFHRTNRDYYVLMSLKKPDAQMPVHVVRISERYTGRISRDVTLKFRLLGHWPWRPYEYLTFQTDPAVALPLVRPLDDLSSWYNIFPNAAIRASCPRHPTAKWTSLFSCSVTANFFRLTEGRRHIRLDMHLSPRSWESTIVIWYVPHLVLYVSYKRMHPWTEQNRYYSILADSVPIIQSQLIGRSSHLRASNPVQKWSLQHNNTPSHKRTKWWKV